MTIAIYLRISVEDVEKKESQSITSQRDLLGQYLEDHPDLSQYPIVEFVDEGYSGTHFERPGIKALLQQVRQGKVQCVVVKDFSRLGRNYIEVGDLLEQVFPFFDVRCISLGDHYDSAHGHSPTLDIALKTLIYDLYSKDLSQKVKSGLNAKKRKGQFAAPRPLYGYKKSPAMPNGLAIDEPAAKVIRHVFTSASQGKSPSAIAQHLNAQGAPSRSGQGQWTPKHIREILKNQAYTGTAITNKTRQAYPGSPKQIPLPKSQWLVVSGAHPPIIPPELYQCVN